ncbi:MAG TPA: YdeI/OmpD-associated family protein [Terriglobales bacterium]|nr:YdeI/OmpD-associated family protein [Terriglobales bacterium]
MAVRLMETMEAEIELPPQIRVALAGNAHAKRGWELMPAAYKRRHLLGIFYYRTPEGRARRITQALEAAEQRAGRDHPNTYFGS